MDDLTLRLPAEWEPQSGVLLSWPHQNSDWGYMLDEVTKCFLEISEAIVKAEKLIIVAPDIEIPKSLLSHIDNSNIFFYHIDTNDTWARDFGGITIQDNKGKLYVCDFKFNGWGLKFASNHDNLITSQLHELGAINANYINELNFVLEGGSIESDGNGTLFTTSECLLSKNRNGAFTKSEIEKYLKAALGAKRVLWIDFGALEGDDTDSHIDTLVRIAPNDVILYVSCENKNDSHFNTLKKMEEQLQSFKTIEGTPYSLIKLPHPDPIYDTDGERLPATYANFLIMNNQVLVPIYGQIENDKLAISKIQIAFPDYKIIGIDCNSLIKQHGSLHCVTMQFPQNVL